MGLVGEVEVAQRTHEWQADVLGSEKRMLLRHQSGHHCLHTLAFNSRHKDELHTATSRHAGGC